MQKISNCGEIQNIVLTAHKVLNVLMYGSLCYNQIQYVTHERGIMGKFLLYLVQYYLLVYIFNYLFIYFTYKTRQNLW